MSERNVCRCPMCGSTKAHYDAKQSKDGKTFMTCPNCTHGGLYEAFEVTRDWYVQIELPDGAPVPAVLPPQGAAERAAADADLKWLVMAHNSYAREDRVVSQHDTESEAKQAMAQLQAQPDADHMWIVRAEP